MIRRLLIIVLWLPTLVLGKDPAILILGDSLSAGYGLAREEGWGWLLDQRLRQGGLPHQVINASVSGETTAGGLTRLPALLEQHAPAVMVLELGANDGLRGFATQVIQDNLTALIRQGRASGSLILLLGIRLPPNYGAAYRNEFQGVFQTVSRVEGVALVPDFLSDVAEHWDLMQEDGLHPTAAAQGRILENLWPSLVPLLSATAETGSAAASR
jgi:acyl-CoA thioesterase-1